MKKILKILNLVSMIFILSACFSKNDQIKTSFNKKKYSIPEAYSGCIWEKNKNDILSFSSQNCQIGKNKIRIHKGEDNNQFFFEVDSGSGFLQNKLALELFHFEDIGDSNAKNKWRESFLNKTSNCDFKKNLLQSNGERDYLLLVSGSGTSCGSYGAQSDKGYKNFFLFYPEKKENIIFIRQFSDKKIINENSLNFK